MDETDVAIATLLTDSAETTFRCTACGTPVRRLHAARWPVRSLALGRDVKQGDLLCEHCLLRLEEEMLEEELDRGPA
ncbi:MAG TPA: hypothetical protein VKX16_12945 [Chloroflexota bacterium]|nr:hypothetical protein [Chloroflexota bacterium]